MKNKKMKKIIGVMAVIAAVMVIPLRVKADENALVSKGNIVMYKEGTNEVSVALYAEDIEYLKNEIEALKNEFQ